MYETEANRYRFVVEVPKRNVFSLNKKFKPCFVRLVSVIKLAVAYFGSKSGFPDENKKEDICLILVRDTIFL